MADLSRVKQTAYSTPFITHDTAKALTELANVLGRIQDSENVDITDLIKEVRSNNNAAAAMVWAALLSLSADTKTITRIRANATAMRRITNPRYRA